MTINVSGKREQLILSLLQAGNFASAEEVIDEGLRLVMQRYQAQKPAGHGEADVSRRSSQQLENLRRLGQKLDAMPTAPVGDLKRRDRQAMTLDDFTEADMAALEQVRAPTEAAAFDHEVTE